MANPKIDITAINMVSTVIKFNYQNLQIIRNIFGCLNYDCDDYLYVYPPTTIIRKCNNITSITELFYKNNNMNNINELMLTDTTTEDEFKYLDKKITSELHSQGLPIKNNTIIDMELTFGISCSSSGVVTPKQEIGARKKQILGAIHGFDITNIITGLIYGKECLIKAGIQENCIKMTTVISTDTLDD
jgi:hypothetical protein